MNKILRYERSIMQYCAERRDAGRCLDDDTEPITSETFIHCILNANVFLRYQHILMMEGLNTHVL